MSEPIILHNYVGGEFIAPSTGLYLDNPEPALGTVLSHVPKSNAEDVKAAVDAAKRSGLPERGTAFRALLDNCNLNKRPDQVLAALHYLRDVEGVNDSPPRVLMDLFADAGIGAPGNLSLYLNRLRDRGFLTIPPSADDKNRYAVLTPEGRAHLDKRSRN